MIPPLRNKDVMEPVKSRRRRLIASAVIAAFIVLPGLVLGWSLFEARWLRVERSVVSHPEVPAEFDGLRVAFVSDIHAGTLLGPNHLRRTIDMVNGLDADLIILGGDYIGGGEDGNVMFYPEAERLEAPLGVVAVLGNHDARFDLTEARRKLPAIDITLLENRNVRIARGGSVMRIAGVADLNTQVPDIEAAAADIPADEYSILLSHNPDLLVRDLPRVPGAFDLALSGHTHGGQITVFGLYAPFIPSQHGQRFRGGWTEVEGTTTLVSRGSGTFVLPMRFFAPPQVHLIELRRGEARVGP